jgi:hypothetical protein
MNGPQTNTLQPKNARNLNGNQNDVSQLRLPQIEFVTFDGAFDKWLSFYNQFNSMVYLNSSLTNIQKLYKFKNCLKGKAEQIIYSLELSKL